MNTYVILLRGINVGGKNIISMSELRKCLEEQGFSEVSTYIASGNVILKSDKSATEIKTQIEKSLPEKFKIDDEIIRILVLTYEQIKSIVENKPKGFGEQPEEYHSDVIFLMGIDSSQAITAFTPREGIDKIWEGNGVIYSQRLSSHRTKSRLNRIMESPLYKSMTIRNWNTTVKLFEILREV